ncbi:MAG: GNAT family N-acetyltransferase [Armatimonadia bacterium]
MCHIQGTSILELGRLVYTDDEVMAWGDGLSPERYVTSTLGSRFALIAELDSSAAGFGILDLSTGEITAMYVLPAFARRGIGTAILDELIAEAKRKGLPRVHCQSSLFAEAFYQKAGFEPGLRGQHRFRGGQQIDYIPMVKFLVAGGDG